MNFFGSNLPSPRPHCVQSNAPISSARDSRTSRSPADHDSAAAFLVEYDWPIAAWLDAHAHVGAGNVFDDHFSGFSLGRLRGSFGGALTIAGLNERQLGVSLAFGTEPLGGGFDVTSYRLILEYSSDY
ncbi:MAG TPA: hypothetical protein VIV40_31850, partial [Kofleriaceae bacterium]